MICGYSFDFDRVYPCSICDINACVHCSTLSPFAAQAGLCPLANGYDLIEPLDQLELEFMNFCRENGTR